MIWSTVSVVRVTVGTVVRLEGDEAVVSLADGTTRTVPIPPWKSTADVTPGLSMRIIEDDSDRPPATYWGEDELVAEREQTRGYVRAELSLRATDDGGRKGPIASGYRPQWDLGDRTEDGGIVYSDAEVWLETELMLSPGCTTIIRLHPFFPEYWERVQAGATLGLYEGNRLLGEARILEVVHPERQ
jgi:hypothetical protein